MTLDTMQDDEILDVVDDEDRVIGAMERSEVYARQLTSFRVVNGFLANENGELWIPRRANHKRVFPSHLDVSVGGHVKSGETYEDAFRRELLEELGFGIADVRSRLLGYLTPSKNGFQRS